MSDEKKPEAIVRRAFVPRRFPGHAFYDDFVKKLEAQFVDAGLVSRVRSKVPQGEKGVAMSDVMRVGGGTFNVPVVHPVIDRETFVENFINWVVRIPLPLELSGPVACYHGLPAPWRNGSTMNPTDPTTGEVNSEAKVDYTPPTAEDVSHAIERTIDHLVKGRTTPDQRRSLGKAVERADRVAPDADKAFGRILGG